jgi:hypothetical protein
VSISSIAGQYSAVEATSPFDPSATRTDASSTQFAAMLAGAMPAPVQTAPPPPPARNSELGEAPDSDDTDTTDDTRRSDTSTDNTSNSAPSSAYGAGRALIDKFGAVAAGLDPALKDKLARVVSRMRDEHGLTVTIAEGVRSQTRQDQLYAQGRTTDGPVVTWTRNSLHSAGRAADLKIDGGYTDQTGFTLLRQIAAEEGLHTLGARDPGHVELPTAGRTALDSLGAVNQGNNAPTLAASLTTAAVARPAIVSAVSPVARIANVAATATIAAVAETGSGQTGAGSGGSNGAGGRSTNAKGDRNSDLLRGGAPNGPTTGAATTGADAYAALNRASGSRSADDTAFSAAALPDSSSAAARANQMMDLQDSAGAQTLSRLSLSVDDGRGGQDQIRVGMSGTSVGASFDMGDAASADRIASRLGELTRALEGQGLQPQSFQVRSSAALRDSEGGSIRLGTVSAQTGTDSTNTRQDGRPDTNGNARQRSNQQNDQHERAQSRSDDRRKRATIFSLAGEDK